MMDEIAASQHGPAQVQRAPSDWADAQESLAAASGLSLLLVSGPQPPALVVSNNNSICQAFQSSGAHVHLCDPYCGQAYARALDAGTASHYRCHAGLHCFAMPVEPVTGQKLAVIGGRTFLTSADYRALAERFRVGDLQDLLSSDLFKNVIFAGRQDLEDLARRLYATVEDYRNTHTPHQESAFAPRETTTAPRETTTTAPRETTAAPRETSAAPASPSSSASTASHALPASHTSTASHASTASPAVEIRSVLPAEQLRLPPDHEFREVCGAAVQALAEKHGLASVALLLRDKAMMTTIYASGRFDQTPIHIEVGPKDSRMLLTARAGASLPLHESAEGLKPLAVINGKQDKSEAVKTAELFPLVVGDEVKGALLVGDPKLSETKRRAIASFCHDNALSFEVLRLRSELDQRARFADFLQTFTHQLNAVEAVEPAETYRSILRHSIELLHSERGSILLFDESANELTLKATVGPHAKGAAEARVRPGEGVAGTVLRDGRPLLVRDVEATAGYAPAPAERRYKTKSFISYPIMMGGRKVGVLNVTDKMSGDSYDELDLNLLEVIAPQMALALDRAEWRDKAAQFQLMSITDPLTGLLNRRYLEQRLAEEVRRSQRQGYEMSFMMIDIDDFKLYNDLNGHQAGDLALEMTARSLKSVLRSADVASRYGGEEFSILLPQTSLAEATAIGERIRRRVERARYPHGKTQPHGAVTVSIGVSTFSTTLNTPEIIIGAADRALYLAKRQGKNRVHFHAEGQPESKTGATQNEPGKQTPPETTSSDVAEDS
jgi:diguanylate cyclase (GGDEF)-like protein